MQLQSILLITQRVEERELLELILNRINITSYSSKILDIEKNSIGIKDISEILENISLKKDRVELIIIKNSQKLTTEAQNSLLKSLEEPGSDTLIVLHAKSRDRILETIISRCILIEDIEIDLLNEDKDHIEYLFRDFASLSYLERDKLIEDFLSNDRGKEDIKEVLTNIIKSLEKAGKEESVNVVLNAYKSVDFNVSSKLILDYISFNI